MQHCFVHAADLHLDTPFEGIGEVAPHLAELLRDASLQAFDRLVQLALDRRAAFVVLAGDVYDGPERGVRAQLRFLRGLETLAEAGIPTFVAHGNHDPVEAGWSAISRWPEPVTVFPTDEVASVPVVAGGEQLAVVHGISFPERAVTENLAHRFPKAGGQGLQVGVLHCSVGDQPEHAAYSPCTLGDLQAAGMEYWALGHVHRRAILRRAPWVVYPGNTQGRSPKPSEQGAKGALVVGFEPGSGRAAVEEPEFVALDAVRFAETAVAIDELDDLAGLRSALARAGAAAREQAEGRALILRARLTGRGPVHAALRRGGGLDELVRDLRDEAEGLDPPLWWDRLRDETRPAHDRAALRGRGDFIAEILASADALRDQPDELAALVPELGELAERLGLQPPDPTVLLDAAETAALDLLDRDESG